MRTRNTRRGARGVVVTSVQFAVQFCVVVGSFLTAVVSRGRRLLPQGGHLARDWGVLPAHVARRLRVNDLKKCFPPAQPARHLSTVEREGRATSRLPSPVVDPLPFSLKEVRTNGTTCDGHARRLPPPGGGRTHEGTVAAGAPHPVCTVGTALFVFCALYTRGYRTRGFSSSSMQQSCSSMQQHTCSGGGHVSASQR